MRGKLAACTAVLVAAASIGMCCRPVLVYADAGEFAGYADYGVELSSTAVESLGGSTEALTFAGYALVFSALAHADDLYRWADETGEAVVIPATHIAIRGEYVYRGKTKQGVLLCYNDGMRTGKGFSAPLFKSSDITVEVGYTSPNDVTVLWADGGVPNNSFVRMQTYQLATSVEWSTSLGSGGNGQLCGLSYSRPPAPDWGVSLPDASYIKTLYNSPPPIMAAGNYVDLPGQDFNLGQIANKWNTDVLPALQQYPDLLPYLPEPFEEPDTPIYPTGDFVTGIPKEWTIENPLLPTSPEMSIDIPDASLPDLSGVTQYTEGVGFWWALTGWLMDAFGIREIVLLLIGIGVFAYVLYRLGAG